MLSSWASQPDMPGHVLAQCDRHHCHARGCDRHVKPTMLMCPGHWSMVPRDLQRAVYATYREGQCDGRRRPSDAWQVAAERAINAVAAKENRPVRHWLLGVDLLHDRPCERTEVRRS